jgi:hypothetical protein
MYALAAINEFEEADQLFDEHADFTSQVALFKTVHFLIGKVSGSGHWTTNESIFITNSFPDNA